MAVILRNDLYHQLEYCGLLFGSVFIQILLPVVDAVAWLLETIKLGVLIIEESARYLGEYAEKLKILSSERTSSNSWIQSIVLPANGSTIMKDGVGVNQTYIHFLFIGLDFFLVLA